MAQGVVADNWSLQDISALFAEGLETGIADEIVIKSGRHSYSPVPSAVIQTEALFDFITDLILRDEILVEEQFTDSWERVDSPLLKAKNLGFVRAYSFLSEPEKLEGPRDRIINHICSTQSLRLAHEENVEGWNSIKETPDPLLSATLWGGAGMCARSYVYEKSYTPHPLRKRLFINSGFMLPSPDALHQVTTFMNDKRVSVSKKTYGSDALFSSYVHIPALPIRVIQESDSASQLIHTALQMRDEFQSLRDWLKMFQNAMSNDDTESLLKYRKQLDSVGQYIDKRIGFGAKSAPVTMEAGIGIFKIAMQGNPLESMRNQFGIRATLNRLIMGGSGRSELRKYTSMFGERGSGIGYEIERFFSRDS
jgi:predicted metal-dependent enzyme (double-stranded beta helix superfamily)